MKNFFDTNEEKITEKAFSQSLVISIFGIVLCLVALCSATYAWFTGETASDNNTLISGSFDVNVTVTQEAASGGTATASAQPIAASEDGSYTLVTPGTYSVTLVPTDESTVKGYCIVTIDESRKYKTDVILNESMLDDIYTEKTSPFIFLIKTEKENTVVRFESHWGILLEPDLSDENTTILVEAVQTPPESAVTE